MILLCFTTENWISVVSVFLAILTFVIERKITSAANKKVTKESWFLNIIVQPQLENINKYYEGLILKLEEAKTELTDCRQESHDHYLERKTSIQENLKDRRNEFFENFVTLIQSFDSSLALRIQNNLLDLDDTCTRIVDRENFDSYSLQILSNKSKLLAILYENLSVDKKSREN